MTRTRWIAIAVTLASTLLVAVALAVVITRRSGSSEQPRPPGFVPATGKFRVAVGRAASGQPPPTRLTFGDKIVQVTLSGTQKADGVSDAGLTFDVPTDPGSPLKRYALYRAGVSVTVGSVRVTVLDVYVASDPDKGLVDLQLADA